MQTKKRSGFEAWQDGLKSGVENSGWSVYDCEVKTVVGEFNRHLSNMSNYRTLDWRLIKSMLWVETGANSKEWKIRPMQIGVPGDPGLKALLSGQEGGEIILPTFWKNRLTSGTVKTLPSHSIRAGVAYLLIGVALLQLPASFSATLGSSDECTALSQSNMRACLEKQSAASERALAMAEQAASLAMALWDEEPKYIRSAIAALKMSSKSFMQFRQAQCGFVASLGGGAIGNALALRRLACVTDLNRQQAASIQQAVANLPVK